ncbi:hypothetical protein [Sodalis glossinidius]
MTQSIGGQHRAGALLFRQGGKFFRRMQFIARAGMGQYAAYDGAAVM